MTDKLESLRHKHGEAIEVSKTDPKVRDVFTRLYRYNNQLTGFLLLCSAEAALQTDNMVIGCWRCVADYELIARDMADALKELGGMGK